MLLDLVCANHKKWLRLLNNNLKVWVNDDGKLVFTDGTGADSVLNFSSGASVGVTYVNGTSRSVLFTSGDIEATSSNQNMSVPAGNYREIGLFQLLAGGNSGALNRYWGSTSKTLASFSGGVSYQGQMFDNTFEFDNDFDNVCYAANSSLGRGLVILIKND